MNLDAAENVIAVQSPTVDLGDTFRDHVRQSIVRVAGKYFGRFDAASVHVSREGPFFRCTVNVQVAVLKPISAEAQNQDCYAAFKNAMAKVEKQLRRAKRELREDKATRTDKDMALRDGLGGSPAA